MFVPIFMGVEGKPVESTNTTIASEMKNSMIGYGNVTFAPVIHFPQPSSAPTAPVAMSVTEQRVALNLKQTSVTDLPHTRVRVCT